MSRLFELYAGRNFEAAGVLALEMQDDGPLQAAILAHIGILTGRDDWYAAGLAALDRSSEGGPILLSFDQEFIAGHAQGAHMRGESGIVLKLLEISRRLNGQLGRAFPAPLPDLIAHKIPALLPQTQTQAKALTFQAPNPDPARPARRVLIMINKFWFGPQSREHELGPRLQRGFTRAGWPCRLAFPAYDGRRKIEVTAESLLTLVTEFDPEVLIFDNFTDEIPAEVFHIFLDGVRHRFPNTRLVHLNLDPWFKLRWDAMREMAVRADLVWSHFPSAGLFEMPEVRDKACFVPWPIGIDALDLPAPDRDRQAIFQGSVEWFNVSRAYWLAALDAAGAGIGRQQTKHEDDGLSALDSYRLYLSRFRSPLAVLNLSLRLDGSRIITGRSFETIFAGACLIQERSEDLDYYFRPSEHYVSFTSFDELRAILAVLETEPETLAAIAEKGRAFYAETYADPKLIAYFDRELFGP